MRDLYDLAFSSLPGRIPGPKGDTDRKRYVPEALKKMEDDIE